MDCWHIQGFSLGTSSPWSVLWLTCYQAHCTADPTCPRIISHGRIRRLTNNLFEKVIFNVQFDDIESVSILHKSIIHPSVKPSSAHATDSSYEEAYFSAQLCLSGIGCSLIDKSEIKAENKHFYGNYHARKLDKFPESSFNVLLNWNFLVHLCVW